VIANIVTAHEHDVLPIGSKDGASPCLSELDAQCLARIALARPGFCTRGHRSVRLAQYAGLVRLDGRILEVLPKVGDTADGRGTALRLLRLAHDLPLHTQGAAAHDLRRDSLLDVFVQAFLEQVSALVRRGLARRYLQREDDLRVIRGRLLLTRQAGTHAMRIDRLACRYDELTIDNPWNQVLKAALGAVRPYLGSVAAGRHWFELSAVFDEVMTVADPVSALDALRPDRQVAHYAPALRWARWLLRLLAPNLRAGTADAPDLLFDMNRLFEAAVARTLGAGARGFGATLSAQDSGRFLASADDGYSRHYGLRPDLVVRRDGEVVAVGDTKWTALPAGPSGHLVPPEAHVYQIHAYASVYPCEDFALIYPWHEGLRDAQPTAYNLPSRNGRRPVLQVLCIDVGADGLPLRLWQAASGFAALFGREGSEAPDSALAPDRN
jgi:5-methylcytosine-specific restriction enzyme subunit McrC